MSNLEKAKAVIKGHISDADCGIFNSRNIAGDWMENIYDDGNLVIDICYGWEYFEVFGLTDDEFKKLENYYNDLRRR